MAFVEDPQRIEEFVAKDPTDIDRLDTKLVVVDLQSSVEVVVSFSPYGTIEPTGIDGNCVLYTKVSRRHPNVHRHLEATIPSDGWTPVVDG